MTTTSAQSAQIARLVEHTPKIVNGLSDMARPFFTVDCNHCLVSLNSGHWYYAHELHFAQALADQHNADVHGMTA